MITRDIITEKWRSINISKSLSEKTTVFTENNLVDISHIENAGSITPLPLGDGTFFVDRLTSYKIHPVMRKYGILDSTGKLNQLEVYIDGAELPKGTPTC